MLILGDKDDDDGDGDDKDDDELNSLIQWMIIFWIISCGSKEVEILSSPSAITVIFHETKHFVPSAATTHSGTRLEILS